MISRQMYIILAIISVIIFMYFFSSFLTTIKEGYEKSKEISNTRNILEKIINDPKCLGLNRSVDIDYEQYALSSVPVLDYNKIKYISENYDGVVPFNCTFFDVGYRLRIVKYPLSFSSKQYNTVSNSVWEELFPIIDKKNVTFVVDFSYSMGGKAGSCDNNRYGGKPDSKICCLGMFLIEFVQHFSEGTNISIVEFGHGNNGHCGNVEILLTPTTITDENRGIISDEIKSELVYDDSTPLAEGLEKALEHVDDWNTNLIVLLTDGCRSDGCKSPKGNYPIPIYSIGFGTTACMDDLHKISDSSGGKVYSAPKCVDLVSMKTVQPITIDVKEETYNIGRKYLSTDFIGKSFLLSYPVIIYYNSSFSVPGKVEIEFSNDWLEKMENWIEYNCLKNTSSHLEVTIPFSLRMHYDSDSNKNMICVNYHNKEFCQPLLCDKEIIDKDLPPGKHNLYIRVKNDKIEIV